MGIIVNYKTMKKLLILSVVVALLFVACKGKSSNDELRDGGLGIGIDTATVNDILQSDDTAYTSTSNEIKEMDVKETPKHHNSSSSYKLKVNNDNMRGFDPASEDDMPDNGMSRYMENNDEEGWD